MSNRANSARARIVDDAADYRWSSDPCHALGHGDALLSPSLSGRNSAIRRPNAAGDGELLPKWSVGLKQSLMRLIFPDDQSHYLNFGGSPVGSLEQVGLTRLGRHCTQRQLKSASPSRNTRRRVCRLD